MRMKIIGGHFRIRIPTYCQYLSIKSIGHVILRPKAEESLGRFSKQGALWPEIKIVACLFTNETGVLARASGILHVASLVQNDIILI